jgi:hypothetical protein
MLFNYCLALRNLGRFDEATEAARVTVDRWEHRDGGGDMHLFIAIEDALAGQADEAELHLKKVIVREDVRYDRQMATLTRALVQFHRARPIEKHDCWREVRGKLSVQFPWETVASLPRDERLTFARAGRIFGARGILSNAWWWFNARLYWPWGLVWLVPVTVLIFDPEGFSSRFFFSLLAGMGAGLLARWWVR